MAEKQWQGQTFGSEKMHHYLIKMLRFIDVRVLYVFAYCFVIPVCLLVRPSRKIIYSYLRRRMKYGRWRAIWGTYVNHCLFAEAVIDKFAMYAGKHFQVHIEGYAHYEALLKRPEGFVQLSAHVGNYELAGYTLQAKEKRINALVYAGEKASLMERRNEMLGNSNICMIPVGTNMDHLFAIDQAFKRGEIVSLVADRRWGSSKTIATTFLSAPIRLPLGPFSVAVIGGLDVVSIQVMKTSWRGYTIFVHPLVYDKAASRRQQVKELAQAYVDCLEKTVKRYPLQWYNYFDFWAQ